MGEQIMDTIFCNKGSVEETADHIVKSLGSAVDYATIVADVIHPDIPQYETWQPITTGAEKYSVPPSPIITTIPLANGAKCSI